MANSIIRSSASETYGFMVGAYPALTDAENLLHLQISVQLIHIHAADSKLCKGLHVASKNEGVLAFRALLPQTRSGCRDQKLNEMFKDCPC